MAALDDALERRRHVVAEVVEAELGVRAVGDVGLVRHLAKVERHHVLDEADGHAEPLEDAAVPLGVALGEVVVHRHEVDAGRRQRVQVERRRGDEGLALTGLHLGDVALVEDDAAHHLDVEHPLLRLAPARLAHGGERLEQQLVERLAVREALAELDRLRAQLVVGERLEVGLERGDVLGLLLEPLHAPPLAEAKDLLELAEFGGGHLEERLPGGAPALIDSSQRRSPLREQRSARGSLPRQTARACLSVRAVSSVSPLETTPRSGLDPELRAALGRIARVPQLLIGCDYDGTLAPLVDDPAAAGPLPEAVAAVRALAALPQTVVAVISGRALRDLATLSRLPSEVHLVGSHGSEFDLGFIQRLPPELHELHARLLAELKAIRASIPASGSRPSRRASPCTSAASTRRSAIRRSRRSAAGRHRGPISTSRTARTSIELSLLATDKGAAVTALRVQASASAVLYLGDDVTDENAFARLHGPDVGVKIGGGETLAAYRVEEPIDAVRVLGFLLEMRRHWLYGDHAVPIERHSMLSNGSTVALLAPDAKVTWLCHPRPDSAAIFADILGGSRAGYFSVTPGATGPAARAALPAGHDDGRDALVGGDGDGLAGGCSSER